jgi:serine/threonine protein kinase
MRFEVSNCRLFEGLPGTAARTHPVDRRSFLREWVEGTDLRRLKREGGRVPDGFFGELRAILDAIHGRGVAYNDLEKKDNVLLAENGMPVLIDYQISVSEYRGRLGWLRSLSHRVVCELQRQDLRYLYKMKRRHRPDLLTVEEERISRERSRAARIYYPLWRVLHGVKRWLIPKGASSFRVKERRPSC